MSRISLRAHARKISAMALARIIIIATQVALFPQATLAADDATVVDNPAPKISVECARRDLELFSLIERNGNNNLSSAATLLETADMMETARAACDTGHTDDALALYDTALRRLENPSDLARR